MVFQFDYIFVSAVMLPRNLTQSFRLDSEPAAARS